MNERIQKLYLETTGKDWVYDFDPDYAEQFAELIVRECAKRSEELGQPEVGMGLMKHFGVSE